MSKTTDELIAGLSEGLTPTPRGAVARRIALGLGAGAAASTVLMLAWLGVRPDILAALGTTMFWVKFFYAALAAAGLAVALGRLARPDGRLGWLVGIAAAPFVLMALTAAGRLALAAPEIRVHLMMGVTANVCPWRIYIIGLPLLAGAVWAVRGLAPTRLTLAGLVAGGCAGALSAVIYGFHCDETAAPFVAIWYTLGMAAVATLGGLAGSRWLRWR
jgi:hypothetical protein